MRTITCLLALTFVTSAAGFAQNPAKVPPAKRSLSAAQARGVEFLRNTQAEDGSWTTPKAPGITALVITSLLKSGVKPDDPVVQRGLNHLLSHVRTDGGIYFEKSQHRNYETCIAILALSAANQQGRYKKQIKRAELFLKGLQWDEGEGVESSDAAFGGAGYGSHERPDLSNTQFFIEALKAAGAPKEDPALQNALKFVSRAQNLESEHNTLPFAARINDGGFYYTPAAGGETKSSVTPNGGLCSYGSMTYAGLKSMIYAGLNSKDKRVKAAFQWIQRNYTVDENPGVGQQGLFYYYHTFAKALSVLDVDYVIDPSGRKHDWRKDIAGKLIQLQYENGSWLNKADRWYEGDPNLVTAYSLLALSYCDRPTRKSAAPKSKKQPAGTPR